ncbi:outer membrane protein assembly factor BamD [Rhodothermaceae bacterium RA]|nr:outer membrane protein assembly factor BamD [Rhodothermaceae bacterium RA]
MTLRAYLILALVPAMLLMSGCGGSGRLRYESPSEAYEKGMAFYERGKYDRAIEYLRGVFDFGRTNEWAGDAQYYLAQAYYRNGDYIIAASEFSRFAEIYRSDPRAPEAHYMQAMSYYQLSPQFELDQTETRRALNEFLLFIERYPNNPLVPEANARILELRNKLAHKMYASAGLYERRELHEAAAFYYERVFDQYPDTPWADDALVGAMRNYIAFARQSVQQRQPERLRKAIDNYDRLIQIFPDSPLLKTAEQLYEEAADLLRMVEPPAEPSTEPTADSSVGR